MATEALIDPSVVVSLTVPEDQTAWSENELKKYEYYHILDLAYFEVVSALASKVSQKRITSDESFVSFYDAQNIMGGYVIHRFEEVLHDSLKISIENKISAYDAAHISLASGSGLSFVTLDNKLKKRLAGTKYYDLVDCPA